MPNSTASRSRALTTSAPALCPSSTGSPRPDAHRPLPSVMMATYCALPSGSLKGRSPYGARASPSGELAHGPEPLGRAVRSNLEDLFLFALEQGIEVGDLRVGELLQLLLAAALVVGADVALVLQGLQVVHDVAADGADLHAAVLGQPAGDLDELAPALLVELG